MDTVAVCDTEPIAIEGLRRLLESGDCLRVVAAETSLTSGMEAARRLRPSILVVDKAFGYRAVSDWISALRAGAFPVAAVVWGDSFSEAEAVRLVQAGAAGVLRKTAPLDAVLECLRAVRAGNTWTGDNVLHEARDPAAHSPLTNRELEVMDLVRRGMRNKDIACALGIQVGTVKIHLKHIFEKTGVHDRYDLALSTLKERSMQV